jgi:hypothetical protein
VTRQVFLPSFTIANLMTQGETVAISVDPAFFPRIEKSSASSIFLDCGDCGTAVDPITGQVVPETVA